MPASESPELRYLHILFRQNMATYGLTADVKNILAAHIFKKKAYLCTLCLTKLTFSKNAKNEN
mgnify:FL=1